MNPRQKQRLGIVGGIAVLITGAIALMLFALTDNIDLFYTPSEVVDGKQGQKPQVGQRLRIGGMVVPGTVERDVQTLDVEFDLVDTGAPVTVRYNGILPDLFREGQGIVATGVLVSPTVIVAHEVLAKHDEEYMPPELAEKMKGIRHEKPDTAYPASSGDKT